MIGDVLGPAHPVHERERGDGARPLQPHHDLEPVDVAGPGRDREVLERFEDAHLRREALRGRERRGPERDHGGPEHLDPVRAEGHERLELDDAGARVPRHRQPERDRTALGLGDGRERRGALEPARLERPAQRAPARDEDHHREHQDRDHDDDQRDLPRPDQVEGGVRGRGGLARVLAIGACQLLRFPGGRGGHGSSMVHGRAPCPQSDARPSPSTRSCRSIGARPMDHATCGRSAARRARPRCGTGPCRAPSAEPGR